MSERHWVRTRCGSGSCVEVSAVGEGTVAIRSSESPLDKLRITREEWVAFVVDVKAGHFDEI